MRFTILTISFLFSALLSYSVIEKRNRNTQLRLEIPRLKNAHERLVELREEMELEIERFESPEHLVDIWLKERFAHLQPLSARHLDEEFVRAIPR